MSSSYDGTNCPAYRCGVPQSRWREIFDGGAAGPCRAGVSGSVEEAQLQLRDEPLVRVVEVEPEDLGDPP